MGLGACWFGGLGVRVSVLWESVVWGSVLGGYGMGPRLGLVGVARTPAAPACLRCGVGGEVRRGSARGRRAAMRPGVTNSLLRSLAPHARSTLLLPAPLPARLQDPPG